MSTPEDRTGAWAAVTLREACAGRGWYMHRIVSVTRWASRERALTRVRGWFRLGRGAVLEWGDDLLLDSGHLGSSPELTRRPRIIAALALDKHEPQFAADHDGPDVLPNGLLVGCTCGWALESPAIWIGDAEHQYAGHIVTVFPMP